MENTVKNNITMNNEVETKKENEKKKVLKSGTDVFEQLVDVRRLWPGMKIKRRKIISFFFSQSVFLFQTQQMKILSHEENCASN